MNIIHFDLGSNMALAHNGCGDVVVTKHFVAKGSRAQRMSQTLDWLVKVKYAAHEAGIKFDVAHYERPFSRGFDATRCGWGIAGLVESVFGNDCVVLDSTPADIKKFALGKIKRVKMTSAEKKKANAAEKLAMIDVAQFWGYQGNNEHEADAFLGLKYAETEVRKTT